MLNVFDVKPLLDPTTYGGYQYNPAWANAGIVGRYFRTGHGSSFEPAVRGNASNDTSTIGNQPYQTTSVNEEKGGQLPAALAGFVRFASPLMPGPLPGRPRLGQSISTSGHLGQRDITLIRAAYPDLLNSFLVSLGWREEDIRNKGLGITVVKRKPARLYLYHDAVSWLEHMVGVGQSKLIRQRRVGSDRSGLVEAFAIAAAQDVHCHRQLIATQVRMYRNLVWIDIDQLDYPVAVGATG